MNKRFLAGSTLALLAGLSSCRVDSVSDGPRIALVTKAMDSEFWLSMKQGAESRASQLGADLKVQAPQREILIHEQVNILEDLLVTGIEALIVAPSGVAELLPVLERFAQSRVPVVIVDTDIEWDKKVTYVGTDNRRGGELAGQFLAEKLGRGKVALVRGIPGVASQDQRAEGFLRALQAAPGLELVARQSGNSERAVAMGVMEDILSAQPDLNGVFVSSDEMALGVVEAMDAAGRRGQVLVVGFDGGNETFRAMREGRIDAIAIQHPELMGRLAVEAALKSLRGEAVESRIDSGTELVTRENLDQFESNRSTAGN